MEPRKRRFGDRKDGWRLRHTQAFFAVVPHLMKQRCDALVYFDEWVEIDELEKYVRRIRKERDLPSFSLYHVILAGAVRMFVLRPYLNRFVMNGKVFARNNLSATMSVKRELTKEGQELCLKPYFEKTDTVFDVYRKMNDAVEKEAKAADGTNGTDVAATLLNHMPAWIVRLIVNVATFCDHHGWMNKLINSISPFHTSFFITDVGSIGIGSIYHHIYNFGTTSAFVSMGKKELRPIPDMNGEIQIKKCVCLRFVLDERICDGQYFAESFRTYRRLLKHPELLEVPPTEFPEDDWI